MKTKLGVDATRLDRVDDGAVCCVSRGNAVSPLGTCAALTAKVNDVVGVDKVLVLESGLNGKHTILDEDVLIAVGGLFELAIAIATDLNLL